MTREEVCDLAPACRKEGGFPKLLSSGGQGQRIQKVELVLARILLDISN